MKGLTLSLLLAAVPCAAQRNLIADVVVSSTTRFERPKGRGVLAEGKPLEVLVWGSGGAVAGSVAGPPGALIGASVGALCGLLYSIFVVPHNGPDSKPVIATSVIDTHSHRVGFPIPSSKPGVAKN